MGKEEGTNTVTIGIRNTRCNHNRISCNLKIKFNNRCISSSQCKIYSTHKATNSKFLLTLPLFSLIISKWIYKCLKTTNSTSWNSSILNSNLTTRNRTAINRTTVCNTNTLRGLTSEDSVVDLWIKMQIDQTTTKGPITFETCKYLLNVNVNRDRSICN